MYNNTIFPNFKFVRLLVIYIDNLIVTNIIIVEIVLNFSEIIKNRTVIFTQSIIKILY